MKNKSKEGNKQGLIEKPNLLNFNRQKTAELEASLRKIMANPITLPFNHETIENFIKFAKQIIRSIQALKAQQKHYESIQQNYNMIQAKLANHDKIVNSLQELHAQRQKTLLDENKNIKEYYEKTKKNLQQSQEHARTQFQQIRKENSELKYRNQILKKEINDLLETIDTKQKQIKQLKQHKDRFLKVSTGFQEKEPKQNIYTLNSLLCSNIGSKILSYLPPLDIVNLQLLNHQCRIYLTKSKKIQQNLCKNIVRTKDRKIKYYHRHIDYFEYLYHKIPQEIIQFTFYRYQILKQNIGVQILNILNSSANLFQGKFTDIDDEQEKEKAKDQQREMQIHGSNGSQTVIIGGVTINIEKQIRNVRDFNIQTPSNMLEVDENIVREFLEDRKNSKQKINQQINLMYRKIQQSAQLYSADVQSIGLFLKNILKNFSKVFVLSKNLYTQSRNLQSLNTFILRQLSNWNKIQVQKTSQIQDLKAQLQSEKKLRLFFTQKNIKSQQRALAEQNTKLSFQSKFMKQTQNLDEICKQKQALTIKLADFQKELKSLKSDNKQLRKAYENGKQKYNKIIQQLSVVKETILRMNIM